MTFFEPIVMPDRLSNEPKEKVSLRKQLSDWCKAPSPQAEIMEVTPEMAALMLERNPEHNRPLSRRTISDYVRELDHSHMTLTNQGIGFDRNGFLVDGQHRLMSCVEAGKAFETVVVFGLDPKAFMYVDSGRKRTTGHKLHIAGYSDPNNLAAAGRIVLMYDLGNIALRTNSNYLGIYLRDDTKVPDDFVLDFCDENPRFVEMLPKWRSTYYKYKPTPNTLLHAIHWIIQTKHPRLASPFIEQLCLGESLNRSENVYRLREHLTALHLDRTKISKAWQMAWIIDAFNDTRKGKTTKFTMIEGRDFPRILS